MTGARREHARKIRVLIVDDSASVRMALTDILNADPAIEVIATAGDPYIAAQRIRHEVPDVIFLDIEMPRMDGLTFLRKVMAQRPIPIVICSTLAQQGSEIFLEALEAGAVDVVPKPALNTAQMLQGASAHIRDVARAAGHARLRGRPAPPPIHVEAKLTADAILPQRSRASAARLLRTDPIVCIGASTGGTEAIRAVLHELPADAPAIVIVQHMPEKFTTAFARRLDSLCAVTVREAQDGDAVRPGLVLIAPGGRHMVLVRRGSGYVAQVIEGPPVSRHRPSVDVLFRSAAQQAGANALGILLTGMGDDGACGLLEMRHAGAATAAQDEASSIVFGMPKEAIQRGAAASILPLDRVARAILAFGNQNEAERRAPR